jgi:SEL1 protein
LKREIEGGSMETLQKDSGAQSALHKEERALEEFGDDGSPWYPGKAREESRRRRQSGAGHAAAAEEEDPVQVSVPPISSLAILSLNKVGAREKKRRKRKGH